MASLLYIHGFLSSPMSAKAHSMQQWLKLHRPDIAYYCPQLPPYPKPCATILDALISAITTDTGDKSKLPIYVMGSSLGGFWATWLAERYHLQAVLINPAVDIDKLIPSYLNVELKNYHHADTYRLDEKDFNDFLAFQMDKLANLENYWLLAQTGDETLDYRLAQERYKGCYQTIEQGGDHSFQNFENFIPPIIKFFENKSVK
jgi:predicted esterase YcpF (UPF0227 family)